MHFLLFYDVTADYVARRGEFRAEHLALAWRYADRGTLVLAGAVGDPVEGSLLVFRCDSPETVEAFVKEDPYVTHGLVASWRVRPWATVVGELAATPLRGETGEETELRTSRVIDAPRERVFLAFRDPARLERWWGPKGFSSRFATFDFRPGGRWSFVMHGPDGVDYANESVFVAVDAPERVVLEHVSQPRFELTITLRAEGTKTVVDWRQRFDSPEQCRRIAKFAVEANEQNLDRLAAEVLGPA